ncbi:MAG TPA: molybdopterin-binding protein [Trebonia sp.]|nr:molybdopterin-binding protein [Trebonia sp.]
MTRGHNVRSVGEDFAAGELLIPAGRRLRPADPSAAAAAGHVALPVARRPVVAIIPTGDEIRSVGSVLGPGEFTDTNSLLLAARASQAGAVPVVTDVQPDDPDILAAAAREASLNADLVLVIAGSSRGRGDYTAAVCLRSAASPCTASRSGPAIRCCSATSSPAGQVRRCRPGRMPAARAGLFPPSGFPATRWPPR